MVNRLRAGGGVRRHAALVGRTGLTVRMGHIKGQVNGGVENARHATYREEVMLLALGGGEDGTEAMRSYIERRDPTFTGR
jgi:2-(1,2-epoxy-1,2-dihydrophenyl)acetyl-CoA isomerase